MLPFALAAFCGAFLLFLVQPMVARFVLPLFGGAPAVWTVSLLFFQSLLVFGYALAHGLERRFGGRSGRIWLGLLALSCVVLPITPDPAWMDRFTSPTISLLVLLGAAVGLPYLLLSAAAPLLQARAASHLGRDPYQLYAYSNAGSLLALLGYPFVVEPALGAVAQTRLWSVLFAAFILVVGAALWRATTTAGPATAPVSARPARSRVALWIGLSATGSATLLSITNAVCQDVSVTPLFWVLPLAVYLLTFIFAFANTRWVKRGLIGPFFALALAAIVWAMHSGYHAAWWVQLSVYCGGLFLICMGLHGELARLKPAPDRLTGFYVALSAGGALGGLGVAIVAPLVFNAFFELHVCLLVAWLLFSMSWLEEVRRKARPVEGPRLIAIVGLIALGIGTGNHAYRRLRGGAELSRSFFGVLQVKEYHPKKARAAIRHLLDGRISHGFQYLAADRRREPTAYFAKHSGIGLALRHLPARRVAVLGLGVGTLAAYCDVGETFRFYEINPDVTRVALERFTFLSDAPGTIELRDGDARLLLERETGPPWDVLVVDAFSGDAIPTHLLTQEVMKLYLRRLTGTGVLAINVSNRHADLKRVVRHHIAYFGLKAAFIRARSRSPLGPYQSDWLLLTRGDSLDTPEIAERNQPIPATSEPVEWTDDHAPVLSVLIGG